MATFDLISTVLQTVRRGGTADGGKFDVQGNQNGALITQADLPPYTEVARKGEGWTAQTATLFAPIAAYPTTTARLELFNNTQSRVMVISSIFMAQVLATDADEGWGLFAMVTTQKAAPTNTALLVASVSGKDAYTTTASSPLVTAVDTTVVANGWRPWGNGLPFGNAAATPGPAMSVDVGGQLIVPPKRSLCLAPAGSIATASSFQCGATFYWADITVEGVG